MSQSDKYFQFELCALAFMAGKRERMAQVRHYCVVATGRKALEKMFKAEADGRLVKLWEKHTEPDAAERLSDDYTNGDVVLMGADCLGIAVASIGQCLADYKVVSGYVAMFTTRRGRDPIVRIRADIFDDAATGKMCWPEFSVLAALYSCIGKTKLRCVRYSMLQCRAMGCKSPEVLKLCLDGCTAPSKPFTEKQLFYRLGCLQKRGLLVRRPASERGVYYSNRLSQQQLDNEIIHMSKEMKTYFQQRAQSDREFLARLKCIKSGDDTAEDADTNEAVLTEPDADTN